MPHARSIPHLPAQALGGCTLALVALLALLGAAPAAAQSGGGYDLSWNTQRCGGGTSSAGDYEIISTLGIAEAGSLGGGGYALDGGFLVAVSTSLVGVPPLHPGLPTVFALHAAAPNPFAFSTRLDYDMPAPAHVQLSLYDVTGRRVRELVAGSLPAGRHQAYWDGRSDSGVLVAPGVYLVRFESPTFRATHRVVHLN